VHSTKKSRSHLITRGVPYNRINTAQRTQSSILRSCSTRTDPLLDATSRKGSPTEEAVARRAALNFRSIVRAMRMAGVQRALNENVRVHTGTFLTLTLSAGLPSIVQAAKQVSIEISNARAGKTITVRMHLRIHRRVREVIVRQA